MILSGSRKPPRGLAIRIFRATGWKHPQIEALTDEQITVIEQVDPWRGGGELDEPAPIEDERQIVCSECDQVVGHACPIAGCPHFGREAA